MFYNITAKDICKKLSFLLDNGFIVLKNLGKISEERKDSGIMLGVLLCQSSSLERIVLWTVSGVSKKAELNNYSLPSNYIYVDPVVSPVSINKALEKNDALIHSLTAEINSCKNEQKKIELKKQRQQYTDESLMNVFSLYKFNTAGGKIFELSSICKESLPPTGTGECCAPKLLDYCFKNNFTPLDLAECFWISDFSGSSSKVKGMFYPPCKERCSLILPHILELNILYYDKDIVVINKQSGLLSVPGRGIEKQDCVSSRIKRLFPSCIDQPAVHRLDMETSGLMVYALTKNAHKELSKQFENRETYKEYTALLDGNLLRNKITREGSMELFFRVDVDHRPLQIWDELNGKSAVTQWKILDVEKYHNRDVTRVLFIPHTGRTHQLRLAASHEKGFGVPIIGDSLYGICENDERLMLHASHLEFTHPSTNERMIFNCSPEF